MDNVGAYVRAKVSQFAGWFSTSSPVARDKAAPTPAAEPHEFAAMHAELAPSPRRTTSADMKNPSSPGPLTLLPFDMPAVLHRKPASPSSHASSGGAAGGGGGGAQQRSYLHHSGRVSIGSVSSVDSAAAAAFLGVTSPPAPPPAPSTAVVAPVAVAAVAAPAAGPTPASRQPRRQQSTNGEGQQATMSPSAARRSLFGKF